MEEDHFLSISQTASSYARRSRTDSHASHLVRDHINLDALIGQLDG